MISQKPAQQAAVLFEDRDKRSELASPATGLTVAYTLLVAPGRCGKAELARKAYPHLVEHAKQLRRWLRWLLGIMIAGIEARATIARLRTITPQVHRVDPPRSHEESGSQGTRRWRGLCAKMAHSQSKRTILSQTSASLAQLCFDLTGRHRRNRLLDRASLVLKGRQIGFVIVRPTGGFVEFKIYSLASRLRASWMEARVTKVGRVSVRFSKSWARRYGFTTHGACR